jgi:hypothetical protein
MSQGHGPEIRFRADSEMATPPMWLAGCLGIIYGRPACSESEFGARRLAERILRGLEIDLLPIPRMAETLGAWEFTWLKPCGLIPRTYRVTIRVMALRRASLTTAVGPDACDPILWGPGFLSRAREALEKLWPHGADKRDVMTELMEMGGYFAPLRKEGA